MGWGKLQIVLDIIYPPRCVACGGHVDSDYGLCGTCWRQVHFMRGTGCWTCGLSLPGYLDVSEQVICDSCLSLGPPWRRGVAALAYDETGRSLVLALKHGDRHDIVRPAADWMAQVSRVLAQPNMLVAPVPLHWTRLFRRRYNQAALLSAALAKRLDLSHCADLLIRSSRTKSLEGCSTDQRFAIVGSAMTRNPRYQHRWLDRPILLVDDVMTSGATLTAATKALQKSGNYDVYTSVLARVQKQI